MGCNCKSVNKVEKFIKDINGIKTVEKKGIEYWKDILLTNLEKMLNGILVILLLIVICPIICLVLILSFIFKGRFVIPLPPFMFKILKKADKKIKEDIEKQKNEQELSY